MNQIKVLFELDNEGSAHQFQVVTGAITGKDYLFVSGKDPGGFKWEFSGTKEEYIVAMKDLMKTRTTIFVYPIVEEALKPIKDGTKPSKG